MGISRTAPASVWEDRGDVSMSIGGRAAAAVAGEWIDVFAPSRHRQRLGRVPRARTADVDRAVAAARTAQREWGRLHFAQRQRALLAIADVLTEHAEELAVLTAADTGNALRPQARPEAATLAALFRYFGGVASEVKGVVLPAGVDQLQYTQREPVGVVGAILPWNSPLMIAGMKIPAALAAGNAIVVKASEEAPLAVLRLAELCAPYLPAGVLNVLTGYGDECGAALVAHPGVDKVSFTGSTAVGRSVGATAGERLIPASLELGGKSPTIVWPDAASSDRIDETVAGILAGMRITRQGQSCTAGSRLFIHEDVYDEVLEATVGSLQALRVGDPLDEATDMGTLINERQYQRVCDYVAEGRTCPGIDVALDGVAGSYEGLAMGPTLFSRADNAWRLAREEIFGPVIVAIPWRTDSEVVAMANDSHYGLAAYLWCADLDRALGAARDIESGWIQVNQAGGQVVGQSYGGLKQSGIGREFSLEGMLEAFTTIKQVNVRIGAGQRDHAGVIR